MKYTVTCPCLFGLESELKYEIQKIGGEQIAAEDGRVSFTADIQTVAKANLWLSTAERVLLQIGSFNAYSFDELFEGVKNLPWEEYIPADGEFPVVGHSRSSVLASVPDCQAIIKKSIADRLCGVYGVNWCEETGALYRVRFMILKDKVTLYLDTSGTPLHKRGYRAVSTAAPIKETLAAGIVRLARIKADTQLYDPFCGSGTFLIEGAMKALNIAPGIGRNFVCESWENLISPSVFKDVRKEAYELIDRTGAFHGFGSDLDREAVAISLANCKKQGLSGKISVTQRDIADFTMEGPGVVLCNPPYGERLLEQKECRKIYAKMGQTLRQAKGRSFYIITSDDSFEEYFGRRADKKRKLYNGMIKCTLYMYFR